MKDNGFGLLWLTELALAVLLVSASSLCAQAQTNSSALGAAGSVWGGDHVKLEVILVVAIIAVGRHLIQIDFEHTPGTVLLGISGVMLVLTLGYFIIKKAQIAVAQTNQPERRAIKNEQ